MKTPCRIQVVNTRTVCLGTLFSPASPTEELTDWDEEALEFDEWEEDTLLPRDSFGEEENQPPEAPPPARSTLTSYGLFSKEEDGSWRLTYEDSEITGLENHITSFCLAPTGMLILLRQGENRVCMAFEEGARHHCDYGVAGGVSSVVLHTHTLDAKLDEKGGRLFVDYTVEIRGCRTEHSSLEILVESLSQ